MSGAVLVEVLRRIRVVVDPAVVTVVDVLARQIAEELVVELLALIGVALDSERRRHRIEDAVELGLGAVAVAELEELIAHGDVPSA